MTSWSCSMTISSSSPMVIFRDSWINLCNSSAWWLWIYKMFIFLADVSCYNAFASCNHDNMCRVKVGKFLTECQWDLGKNSCDRQACLPAMNSFFQTVDMKHAHAAAFCVCEAGDKRCHSLKGKLIHNNPVFNSNDYLLSTLEKKCSPGSSRFYRLVRSQ